MDEEFEQRVLVLFDEELETALGEDETTDTFSRLVGAEDDVNAAIVEADVRARRDVVLEQVGTLLKAWLRAEEKLTAAKENLKERTSSFGMVVLGAITLVAVIGAAMAAVVLALTNDIEFLALGFVVPYLWLPWFFARTYQVRASSVRVRERARDAAQERFRSVLRDQVTVAIREAINKRLTSFETRFRIFDQRGLGELADPEREVSTVANRELSGLMASLSSGSIGLSGPRGSGKTTLIDSFAHGRAMPFTGERVGIVVSAPVKYDALDFVLHLFASLCEQVLGEKRVGDLALTTRRALRKARQVAAARFFSLVAAAIAVVGLAMLLLHRTAPKGPTETGLFLVATAAVIAYFGLLLWLNARPRRQQASSRFFPWLDPPETQTPERIAEEHLEQIRFQQSITSGWGASMRLPLGIGVSGDSKSTLARSPWSLPEAVEEFRRYARGLADNRYVVIGIDELDKMESDEAAREFLNNVKGVFGVSGCYYLVSVSEDAMSTFERRGLALRDVFDSSFDAIQRVGYLTLDESRDVLEGRVTGLPVPFQCLCHCMAGGLPRDLIRVTRELVNQQRLLGTESLSGLCTAVVEAEVRGKMAAARETTRSVPGNDGEWVVKWLYRQGAAPTSVEALQEQHDTLSRWGGIAESREDTADNRRARNAAIEIGVFNYYIATVLELFGDDERFAALIEPADGQNEINLIAADIFESLANARQQFAVSPWLAWSGVTGVREEAQLDPWADPRPVTVAR